MAKNFELDSLKGREQEAFRRKQSAYQKYIDAKTRASEAYDVMQSAWGERCTAREEMNREFEDMQRSSNHYREVWDGYGRIRDENNIRIESLRHEADLEHQMMKDCFDSASDAYERGDKAEAPFYAAEGRDHKDRRNELNAEVGRLIQEIRDAKADAEWRAPRTSSSAFQRAKEIFNSAKARHESAQAEFKRLKVERDRSKADFDSAREEHDRLKELFQKKLAEVKAEDQRERDKTLDKAGVRWSERKDAKIVKKTDGTTQVYHGGLGSGDGLGHGHTALDQFGNKTYERDAFEKHGSQNFTDSEKTRWDGPHRGIIIGKDRDYEVTFSQGMGDKSGQTIIADGYLTNKEFHREHNHYGLNNKNKYPNEPERIEDSSKHKNDHFYNGPDK